MGTHGFPLAQRIIRIERVGHSVARAICAGLNFSTMNI